MGGSRTLQEGFAPAALAPVRIAASLRSPPPPLQCQHWCYAPANLLPAAYNTAPCSLLLSTF